MVSFMKPYWPARLLPICGALFLLAACGTPREQLLKNRVLRVGVCPDYPPIVFSSNGLIAGVEADLAAYVAASLPATVKFVEMPFDDLIPRLTKGDIDVIMSGMSDADIRKSDVRFVTPYMSIGQMALVRAADAARYGVASNLYQARIKAGCLAGTTGEQFVRLHMATADCVPFKQPGEAVASLAAGSIDIVIDDAPFVLQTVKDHADLAALPWLLTDEHLAWAVPKTKEYDYLYVELDRIVLRGKQRGDIRRILNAYFEVNVRVK